MYCLSLKYSLFEGKINKRTTSEMAEPIEDADEPVKKQQKAQNQPSTTATTTPSAPTTTATQQAPMMQPITAAITTTPSTTTVAASPDRLHGPIVATNIRTQSDENDITPDSSPADVIRTLQRITGVDADVATHALIVMSGQIDQATLYLQQKWSMCFVLVLQLNLQMNSSFYHGDQQKMLHCRAVQKRGH